MNHLVCIGMMSALFAALIMLGCMHAQAERELYKAKLRILDMQEQLDRAKEFARFIRDAHSA